MEDLVHFDEERWQVGKNMNHIQLLRRHKHLMTKTKQFFLKKANWYFGYQRQQKLKEVSLSYHGKAHIKCKKTQ